MGRAEGEEWSDGAADGVGTVAAWLSERL